MTGERTEQTSGSKMKDSDREFPWAPESGPPYPYPVQAGKNEHSPDMETEQARTDQKIMARAGTCQRVENALRLKYKRVLRTRLVRRSDTV
jgi:hypothetical protein